MNSRKASQLMIVLLAIMLLLSGCGGQKYVLECDINTETFGFGITGETGPVTESANSETTSFEYDASGQRSGITVGVNRDLLFEDSQHQYHIEGTIKLNPLTNELTYDITATGDTFGDSPQTCKQP